MNIAPRLVQYDCFLDVTAAGPRAGAPVYAVAALLFDPTGREPTPGLDPIAVAYLSKTSYHPHGFFVCVTPESNAGADLRPLMSERLQMEEAARHELTDKIMGSNAPEPIALRDMFLRLGTWINRFPGEARPVRLWMNRPERESLAIIEAFRRQRGVHPPWPELTEIHSLHTLNRLAYGRGREITNARPLLDPYHPFLACQEGVAQVQQAFRDLAEYGPAELLGI